MATSRQHEGHATPIRGRPPAHPAEPAATAGAGFEKFFSEQYRGLVKFLNQRTATRQDAEDAAQESMARMLRYHESAPASTWQRLLYRIAINVAHDQYRAAVSHRSKRHVSLDTQSLEAPGRSPEDQADHEQRMACLRAAIRELPPKCQRVYLLKRVHGMSHAQIAERCGISAKTVEKHLAKALAKLRQKVGNMVAETFE
ncbi:MAG TPA: sigma-70 family RNA polymerase sigma factor [Oleiagrimonas sp.]|nr:sigma-70 family RNA polymerase sigma factor [Oleiagrimonas sp.]